MSFHSFSMPLPVGQHRVKEQQDDTFMVANARDRCCVTVLSCCAASLLVGKGNL